MTEEQKSGVEVPGYNENKSGLLRTTLTKSAKILIALLLLTYIFSRVGWKPVFESFGNLIWYWAFARTVLVPILVSMQTVRWRLLLKHQGVKVSFINLYQKIWIGRFVNNFLPGQSGGDLYRVFSRWHIPVKRTNIASSVLVDRMIGLAGLFFFVSLFGLVQFSVTETLNLVYIIWFGLVGSVVLFSLISHNKPLMMIREIMDRWKNTRLKRIIKEIIDSFLVYSDKKTVLVSAVILSFGVHLVAGLIIYCDFLALDVSVSIGTVILISAIASIVSLIPITINGWGVYEGISVFLYSLVGIDAAAVLAVAILGRALGTLFSSTIGGILYVLQR